MRKHFSKKYISKSFVDKIKKQTVSIKADEKNKKEIIYTFNNVICKT